MGGSRSSYSAVTNPTAWALDLLGFPPGTIAPSKREVTSLYRARVREAHPDSGGDQATAARLLADLAEARRILKG